MKHEDALPVLMYHSVGRVLPEWCWSELTLPASIFEDHLKWLTKAGYRTASLADWHSHVLGNVVLPPRTVVLTFDDGYVDNWTYVTPLLAKFGFTGTVLVTPEFVDPRDIVRPTLEAVWAGGATENALEVRGFMSWPELEKASQESVLSVQSHGMTHTWYPVSDTIVGFHHPGDDNYWLDWNARPEEKPFYLKNLGRSVVPYGTPLYEHAKSLEARRFYPDEAEAENMVKFVEENGGDAFFDTPEWREILSSESKRWRTGHEFKGRLESPDERMRRIEFELRESKQTIEERLGAPVEFLVWPGGGYDDEAMNVALDLYKAVAVSSKERWKLKNRPFGDGRKISRRGIPSISARGRTHYPGGRYLIEFLKEFKGSGVARKKRQIMKAAFITASNLGLWPGKAY